MALYSAVYAFDVDDTLAIQGSPRPGPVPLYAIQELRNQGIVTGVCGNFIVLMKFLPDWWKLFSFYGPEELTGTSLLAHHQYKHNQLIRIMKVMPASRYVMVGNAKGTPGVANGSMDDVQAHLAKWNFIREQDFARGMR